MSSHHIITLLSYVCVNILVHCYLHVSCHLSCGRAVYEEAEFYDSLRKNQKNKWSMDTYVRHCKSSGYHFVYTACV